MDNEKIENLLNLALDATPEERARSIELNVGFDEKEGIWEVVVRYAGEVSDIVESFPEVSYVQLSNEYAILQIPQNQVEQVATLSEVEFMEKPKRLFFAVNQGKSASCINQLQIGTEGAIAPTARNSLTGAGVIVGCIDSGIDYSHPDFRKQDGTTRIIALWDQTVPAGTVPIPGQLVKKASEGSIVPERKEEGTTEYLQAPTGFLQGTEFTEEIINYALQQPTEQQRYQICPSRDTSGHGTHVIGIAAGNGRASEGRYRGVAYESPLLIVKLGTQQENALPRTSELMQAIDYCIKKAREYGLPLALNLSFGNNYGSHAGNSLLETYVDAMADNWKASIVIGSGNEGAAGGHTSGVVENNKTTEVEFVVSEYEAALNLQVWKNYQDEMAISLVHPNGRMVGPIRQIQGPQRFTVEGTEILLYYGEPVPYSRYQEIYLDFIPSENYIDAGIWRVRLVPQRIVQGTYDMWFPAGGALNEGTRFLRPSPETTLTIPSTASKAITVGAYDSYFNQYAPFSGRGYTWQTNQVKPDLVAPGVDITSCAPGGGYAVRTGTSMATPFVTGAAALLMQWGIGKGNDPYLYGEKLKAFLIKGAKPLAGGSAQGFLKYPNPQLGWGTLCVAESLPK